MGFTSFASRHSLYLGGYLWDCRQVTIYGSKPFVCLCISKLGRASKVEAYGISGSDHLWGLVTSAHRDPIGGHLVLLVEDP